MGEVGDAGSGEELGEERRGQDDVAQGVGCGRERVSARVERLLEQLIEDIKVVTEYGG